MTPEQIKFLIEFKEKRKHAPTKNDSDSVDEVIDFLKSFNIISKKDKSNTLEITDPISLKKLIELKSFSDFENWCSDKDKNIVKNLNNYGDNYGIQSLESDFKNPIIKQTTEAPISKPPKKSLLKKIYSDPWIIGIGLIIIEEIFVGYLRGLLKF